MLRNFYLIFLLSFCFPAAWAAEKVPTVLVSVSPHKHLVERIAGETVKVMLLVPAGSSAHTYEPTPRQMVAASQADIWFKIGENFETRALKTLQGHRSDLKVIDLRDGLDMITTDPESGCHCCHANSQDLHIWLSPRLLKIQAATITRGLSQLFPENRERYETALEQLLGDLDQLDDQIRAIFASSNPHLILVSHPAYAYFSRDYGLRQLSIEFEGKDPTPQQMNRILNQARAAGVKKVFIQAQYPSKGARLFAKELNAEVVTLDPYAENVEQSMLEIARNFANQ